MSTETIKFLIHPFTLFWVLLVVSAVLLLFKKKRLFKWTFFLAVGWFFLISTPMVPKFLLTSLEDRFAPLNNVEETLDLEQEYHVVVLGAGYLSTKRFPATSTLQSSTLLRLIEGVRLYNALPNSKLITSGPDSFRRMPSQAEVAKQAAISLGVPSEDILTQSEPYNTLEEAEIYASKFHSGQRVIIVTDAAHMPRAIYEFNKFTDNPIAAPVGFTYTSKGMSFRDISIVPSYSNIGRMSKALNEHAANLRNWMRDW